MKYIKKALNESIFDHNINKIDFVVLGKKETNLFNNKNFIKVFENKSYLIFKKI